MVHIIFKRSNNGDSKFITQGLDIYQNEKLERVIEELVSSFFGSKETNNPSKENEANTSNEAEVNSKLLPPEEFLEALETGIKNGSITLEQANTQAERYLKQWEQEQKEDVKEKLTTNPTEENELEQLRIANINLGNQRDNLIRQCEDLLVENTKLKACIDAIKSHL